MRDMSLLISAEPVIVDKAPSGLNRLKHVGVLGGLHENDFDHNYFPGFNALFSRL